MKPIEVFQEESGRCPFEEWLDAQHEKTQFKVMAYLTRLAHGGTTKNIRSVGDEVFELKIDYGPGYRVYFGNLGLSKILILWAGDKSTQQKDIVRAKQYWRLRNVSKQLL